MCEPNSALQDGKGQAAVREPLEHADSFTSTRLECLIKLAAGSDAEEETVPKRSTHVYRGRSRAREHRAYVGVCLCIMHKPLKCFGIEGA